MLPFALLEDLRGIPLLKHMLARVGVKMPLKTEGMRSLKYSIVTVEEKTGK